MTGRERTQGPEEDDIAEGDLPEDLSADLYEAPDGADGEAASLEEDGATTTAREEPGEEDEEPGEDAPEARAPVVLPGGVDVGRMLEAMLFAAREPLTTPDLADRLPAGVDVPALLADLAAAYEGAGVQLVESGRGYAFRTAPDLAFLFERETEEERKLSRAALETLAIVAYHQPVSRAEIEEIRGVTVSKGTLDLLMEIGWVRIKGRRRAPGRPAVYGTSEEFLTHFGLASAEELPGLAELKAAGLLEALPPEGVLPGPSDEELDPPDPEDLEGGYGAVFETDPEGDEDDADALAEAAANDDAVADEEDAPPRAANER